MKCININNSKHSLYNSFKELYSVSFPVFEQRTEEQQEKAFTCANYYLIGYEENETFIGFISYWEFDEYIYIEHLAINQEVRGKGYGSVILRNFITSTHKIVLLEIDPVINDISEARLRFYKRCGFHENPYPHTHPPYRNGYKAHSLIILTTKRKITEKEYQIFNKELTNIVMDNRYSGNI
ncbi:GNAT family N-acetyltransferase [Bacteroides sp. AM07-16]|nr:GNAT family N-acetyltransferase [Bacteroides sp. AM07-16]